MVCHEGCIGEPPVNVVLLASGGVDSSVLATLYADRGSEVWPLFINYGQLAAEREWTACQVVMNALPVKKPQYMDLSGFGVLIPSGMTSKQFDINRDAFLPNRNLLLLVAASGYAFRCGATEVVIGLVNEGARLFPDQSSAFLRKAEAAIAEALGFEVRLAAPLLGASKREVLSLAAGLGLSGTYSCHRGTETPCGECVSCREAIEASRR